MHYAVIVQDETGDGMFIDEDRDVVLARVNDFLADVATEFGDAVKALGGDPETGGWIVEVNCCPEKHDTQTVRISPIFEVLVVEG